MARTESKPARWERLTGIAQGALEELRDIQTEYQEWQDNLCNRCGAELVERQSPAGPFMGHRTITARETCAKLRQARV